jgi:CDP-diacylglycerol--serine O-phosphatidyltransferase
MRKIQLLPNLITLGNAFCGLLAIAKAVDALALSGSPVLFYARMEQACMLVFVAMILDALDGFVARLTKSASEIGAQLDSFSDLVTFGVAPAVLAKVLIEHDAPLVGYGGNPRIHFLAAAAFSIFAILRLARFNLESDAETESHTEFRGLPSPAAAGALTSAIWLYLILRRPELEMSAGSPTPFGRIMGWMEHVAWTPVLDGALPVLLFMLPALGLLMVSRLRFVHVVSFITYGRSHYFTLVWLVLGLFLVYLAPVPWLFICFNGYALLGFLRGAVVGLRSEARERAGHAAKSGS